VPDFYELLGVPPTATAAEIRAAYRQLALRWHPDRNGGDAAAEEQFKRLNDAYQVLGDPQRRASYDLSRWYAAQSLTPPEPPRPARERRGPPPGYTPPPPAPAYRAPTRSEWVLWGRWLLVFGLFVTLLVLAKEPVDRWHAVREYRQADELLAEGDTAGALIQLSEAVFHQHEYAAAYRRRGELLRQRVGSEQLAYQDLKAALRFAPTDGDAELRLDLSLVCLKLGKMAEAELHAARAIHLDPTFVRAYLARGLARHEQNNTAGACEDWHQALNLGENAARELVETFCR
jgi:tetratricopeptide (TPR) repeat protein